MERTVCAVVVTYNRKELLRECLAAVAAQRRPADELVVVDNASTDGTRDMLEREYPELKRLALPYNAGGAGGFHAGMRWAFERGFGWVWLMDDDGAPAPDCLEQLLKVDEPALLFRGPLVVAREDDARLAFVKVVGPDARETTTRAEVEAAAPDGLLWGQIDPFNGVLVHRELMARIGFVKPEMFAWGDEIEYMQRAKAAGLPYATVLAAVHRHPENRIERLRRSVLGVGVNVYRTRNAFRDYMIVRNGAYTARRYLGWKGLLRHVTKYTLFYLAEDGPRGAFRTLGYLVEGISGRLRGHRRFLRATRGPRAAKS